MAAPKGLPAHPFHALAFAIVMDCFAIGLHFPIPNMCTTEPLQKT